jgi:hypothetical protein
MTPSNNSPPPLSALPTYPSPNPNPQPKSSPNPGSIQIAKIPLRPDNEPSTKPKPTLHLITFPNTALPEPKPDEQSAP